MSFQNCESKSVDRVELSEGAREALGKIQKGFDDVRAKNDELDARLKTEKNEREALESKINRLPLMIGMGGGSPAREPQKTLETKSGRRLPLFGRGEKFVSDGSRDSLEYRLPGEETPFKSVGEICRAAIGGARNASERKALGQLIDPAGGFLVSPVLGDMLIDLLRARSVVFEAGAQTFAMPSGEVDLVKLTADPVVTWRQENSAVATGDPVFAQEPLIAKSLGCMVKISRELADDAANASQIIEQALAAAMAAEIDRAAIFGDGVTEPLGLLNAAGIGTVSMGVNGAAIASYSEILDAIQQLEDANVDAPTAAILAPRTKRAFSGLADTTGQPLRRPQDIETLPFLHTSKMPVDQVQGTSNDASSIVVGDFTKLIVGIRSEVRIEILRERFADNLQVGLLAWARLDTVVTHPKAFSVINGVTP